MMVGMSEEGGFMAFMGDEREGRMGGRGEEREEVGGGRFCSSM